MKRILAMLLALSMMFVLFGCDFDYAGKLTGTWVSRGLEDDEQVSAVLDSIGFEPEEAALVNTPLYTAVTITFTEGGTYALAEDLELTKQYLREFFDGVFNDLYEGRSSLAGLYVDDVSVMNEDEFFQAYASFYECDSYEALLDTLSEELYTGEGFGVYDQGTFKATSRVISFDAYEDDLDGSAEYELSDDRLTIDFQDGVKVFYKQN